MIVSKWTVAVQDKAFEAQIRRLASDASTAISKANAALTKGLDNAQHEWFTKCFGAPAAQQIDEIKSRVHGMAYAMSSAKITFQYNVNCTAGKNAEAFPPNLASWQDAASPDAASPAIPTISDINSNAFVMTICPLMMSRQTILSTTKQNLIGTFIHEFSHLIANTFDRTLADGRAAYDTLAFTLAGESAMRASQNAENYGFFCANFKS
ncbi:MAG TPA: M35 family metallo-endopeptidase [Terriglobia bacterium]|nr:M35 family metallo-endopeptidase [Terriglobia bacterium]